MNLIQKAHELLCESGEETQILLTEKVRNVTDEETKEKWVDVIWDMLVATYKKAGLEFLSFTDKKDMIEDSGMWKIIFRGGSEGDWGKPSAVAIYKDKNGRKRVASGNDGTRNGVIDMKKELLENDMKFKRTWGEVSDNMEAYILKNYGADFFIPAKFAKDILKKEIIEYNEDGYHYTRMIANEPHEKVLVGFFDDDDLNLKIQKAKEEKPFIPKEN